MYLYTQALHYSGLWSFKVIQGHRNWYQSKFRMRLPIDLPL